MEKHTRWCKRKLQFKIIRNRTRQRRKYHHRLPLPLTCLKGISKLQLSPNQKQLYNGYWVMTKTTLQHPNLIVITQMSSIFDQFLKEQRKRMIAYLPRMGHKHKILFKFYKNKEMNNKNIGFSSSCKLTFC